jgi:hypothetical protein
VQALAERLHARAVSRFLSDSPQQQSDGLVAAELIKTLVAELMELRRDVAQCAESCSDQATARRLRELLEDCGPPYRGAISIVFN